MMRYEIQERADGDKAWKPYGEPQTNAKHAAQHARTLNQRRKDAGLLHRYRVVPIVEVNYLDREKARIKEGIGMLPKLWNGVLPLLPAYHFPRIVKPGYIGFFENERDAAIGRLNTLCASRYLNTFVHHVIQDPLSLAEAAGETVERPQVFFTDVTEEITKVYLSAGREGSPCKSCATNPASDYRSAPIHPSAVYGKPGDTAILYTLADGKTHINQVGARVTARCLVYPDKKIYVQAYGYPPDRGNVEAWLEANGYTYSSDWVGCRINFVTVGGQVVTAQCDFMGTFRIKLENGEPVARVNSCDGYPNSGVQADGSYACYSTSGITGPVQKWKPA